jgi:lysozyme
MKTWQIILIAGVLLGAAMTIKRVTARGIDAIKQREGLRLKAYKDSAGRWTIGYGHLIQKGEEYLLSDQGITENDAELLLRSDLSKAESAIKRLVTVPLTANQFDALVSFVFNIGSSAFQQSTLLQKLNSGDYAGAAAEFPKWRFAGGLESPGLLARRAAEQSTFAA